ncbi:hypothetical protein DM01DRAFT_1380184 [Hesseltinella vesiculosa]|uniref:Extracellular membrane protein CFEM domain-containing protein n=1 Tax=Hesseltinella vesiculosa TaxID=101127 RepID=A0A1X2GWJ0_9FUNG|nr:hypothetical protein DM01DRAFT_1380184 [Hesseltinella vesiculosa]
MVQALWLATVISMFMPGLLARPTFSAKLEARQGASSPFPYGEPNYMYGGPMQMSQQPGMINPEFTVNSPPAPVPMPMPMAAPMPMPMAGPMVSAPLPIPMSMPSMPASLPVSMSAVASLPIVCLGFNPTGNAGFTATGCKAVAAGMYACDCISTDPTSQNTNVPLTTEQGPNAASSPPATTTNEGNISNSMHSNSDNMSNLNGADAGNSEAGNSDAGNSDASNSEAGNSDAGNSEAGNSEATDSEAMNSDASNTEAVKPKKSKKNKKIKSSNSGTSSSDASLGFPPSN